MTASVYGYGIDRFSNVREDLEIQLIDDCDSVSFINCFPETIVFSDNGIIVSESIDSFVKNFDSLFFQLLFADYPSDYIENTADSLSGEDGYEIYPFPNCIADVMVNLLSDGVKMSPEMARSFFFNRLSLIDNYLLWEDNVGLFHSLFPERKDFADKLSFLYSSYSHHESAIKIIQFITINELLAIHKETGVNYQLKDLLKPDMKTFNKEVYKKYHDFNFSFHEQTYQIADLIFSYDKTNKKRYKENRRDLALFSRVEMNRVGSKNNIAPYVSFNTLFSQHVFPGELYISEFNDIKHNDSYQRQEITQDPYILELLKNNSKVYKERKRYRQYERNFQENVHYINDTIRARNILKTLNEQDYMLTMKSLETMSTMFKSVYMNDKTVPLSTLSILIVFMVDLLRVSQYKNFHISYYIIEDFTESICCDDRMVQANQQDIHELIYFFLKENGNTPPNLVVKALS